MKTESEKSMDFLRNLHESLISYSWSIPCYMELYPGLPDGGWTQVFQNPFT